MFFLVLQKYRLHSRKLQNSGGSSSSQGTDPLILGTLYNPHECSESSRASNSQSRSPKGPLHLARNSGVTTSTTGGDCLEEDDEKSESQSWKKDTPILRNSGQWKDFSIKL